MADNIITTIGIAAVADTAKAEESIKSLTAKLERLQVVAKEGNLAESMKKVSTALSSVNTDKIQRFAEILYYLQSVKTVTINASLPERMAALSKAVDSFDTMKLSQIAAGIRGLNETGMFSGTANQFAKVQSRLTALGGFSAAPVLKDIEKQAQSSSGVISKLSATFDKCADALDRLSDSAKKSKEKVDEEGKEAEETEKKQSKLAKAFESLTLRATKFYAALKRIAVYRAIRAVLKNITQGFREGMQNMYQYSLLINGQFKQSMDSLATTSLYLKNSMGALIAPLVNQLAPVIERIVDGFVDFTNVLAELFAMIGGQETWSKALKYPKAYAEQMEGASGAAKELRATLLGFDEINRLDDDRRGGRGSAGDLMDYSKMFEEVTTRNLSDFWDDILHSGEGKFALFAASVAGILALKLSGALGGVFAGSSALALGGKFAALFAAGFAGYRFGNWLYDNDVLGVGGFADYLMENGLGEFITNMKGTLETTWKELKEGFKNTWKGIKEDGKGIWEALKEGFAPFTKDIKEGWDELLDIGTQWGDTLWEKGKSAWDRVVEWCGDHSIIPIHVEENVEGWQDIANTASNVIGQALGLGVSEAIAEALLPYTSPNSDLYKKIDEIANKRKSMALLNTGTKQVQSMINSLANIKFRASGGSVDTGDLFLSNEGGVPELIGQVGHKTHVANNEQITESIKVATMEGNAESNGLLRQAVSILNGILQKDNVVVANVTTDSITSGLDRQNRRNGRTTVPVGV